MDQCCSGDGIYFHLRYMFLLIAVSLGEMDGVSTKCNIKLANALGFRPCPLASTICHVQQTTNKETLLFVEAHSVVVIIVL